MPIRREADLERFLKREVENRGGEVRKVSWPGRRAAPDRLILLAGKHELVELKKEGEEPTITQLLEHERLRKYGFTVHVAETKDEVLAILERMLDVKIRSKTVPKTDR